MLGTGLSCPLQQCSQKRTSMAVAAPCRIHSHCCDVEFISHQPATGQPQQCFGHNKTDTKAPGVVQLTPPLLSSPQPIESALIQRKTGLLP